MPLNLHRFEFFCLKGLISCAARKRVFQLPRSVHECIMQACQEVTPADFAAYMQFHYRNLEVEGSFWSNLVGMYAPAVSLVTVTATSPIHTGQDPEVIHSGP